MFAMSESTITTTEKTTQKPGAFSSRPVRSNGREVETKVEAEPVGPPRGLLREYLESAVVHVIMALFGMTFIVQAVKVPTGSMQNTIVVGDHLLVNKFVFAPGPRLPLLPQREIRRGDIIVFKYPGNPFDLERDRQEDNIPFQVKYVKRGIWLHGDSVELKGLRVFVNGQPLPEHIIVARNVNDKAPLEIVEDTPRQGNELYDVYYFADKVEAARRGQDVSFSPDFNFAVNGKPAKVPANSYFVMGDDRDNSLDSRAWGFVPRELVIGRAMFVYWSYYETQPFSGPLNFFLNT